MPPNFTYQPIIVPKPEAGEHVLDGKWFTSGRPVSEDQGWKLYVSASLPYFLDTLEIVREILDRHGAHYKYVASDKVLRKLNAGLYGYTQIGKNIVGYFEDARKLHSVVTELKKALQAFVGTAPTVPLAVQLGGAFPIAYRYGSFRGESITVGGEELEDDRRRSADWVFAYLDDPLADLREPVPTDENFDAFLARFPVYETLSQGGKGGVFAAFDLDADSFQDLILKIGYRNGQILPDGRDGMALIDTEARFFELLSDAGLGSVAPRFHTYRQFKERSVLMMERIDGDSLMALRLNGSLTIEHLQHAMKVLSQIHAAGLYVGDAKLANFIADDKNGRVLAIDFEAAGRLDRARIDHLCTYQFSQPPFPDMQSLERCHLLYSALHLDQGDTFSESDRIINLPDKLTDCTPKTPAEIWALDQLKIELAHIAEKIQNNAAK